MRKCLLVVLVIGVLMGLTAATAMALPTHCLTGYWQNFTNGATNLKLASVPTTYDIIAVSFANATGTPGAVSFSLDPTLASALGGYTDAQFKADVSTCKGRGQAVVISVGGQNGSISVSDSSSATNFANSIVSLINNYGFSGVDIDLENGISPQYMAQALNSIASQKPGVVITMAPETLFMQSTSSTYFDLALRVKSILTVVNTQYYNSGSMLGYDGKVYSQGTVDFFTALATIQLQGGLAQGQVGLGCPASPSGAGSGYVDPSVVNNALNCLAAGSGCGSFRPPATYPNLRGAMDWSINWDASNGYNFANKINAIGGGAGGGGVTPPPASTPTATKTPSPGITPTATKTPTPSSGGGTWAPNTYYAVGATVTYGGHTYRCIQAHTSLVGWEPPNVPALWQLVS